MKDQPSKLNRLIFYAYENVPYFNNVVNERDANIEKVESANDLNLLPVFTKETIKQYGWKNFVSQEYFDSVNDRFIRKDIRIERTSGTTSEPMDIPWLNPDYYTSMFSHWRFRQKEFGISTLSKKCSNIGYHKSDKPFAPSNNDSIITINNAALSYNNILLILDGVLQFRPEWLYIQPSVLFVILRIAAENGISLPSSIKYVEYVGEPLLPYYKEFIEKYLNCRTVNMYGCAETNGIAYECSNGNLHVIEDNAVVEIVDDKRSLGYDQIGNVCVTGLHNRLMPMIRYRLDDEAIMRKGSMCMCGNNSPILELLYTRLPAMLLFDDVNLCKEGKIFYPLNSLNFIHIQDTDVVFKIDVLNLKNYQVTFYFSHNNNFEKKMLNNIFIKIMHKFGLSNIQFTFIYSYENYSTKIIGILRLA